MSIAFYFTYGMCFNQVYTAHMRQHYHGLSGRLLPCSLLHNSATGAEHQTPPAQGLRRVQIILSASICTHPHKVVAIFSPITVMLTAQQQPGAFASPTPPFCPTIHPFCPSHCSALPPLLHLPRHLLLNLCPTPQSFPSCATQPSIRAVHTR